MPSYEFICHKCNAEFEVIASISEYERLKEKHRVKCTKCGSTNVTPEIVAFEVRTSRKSA